MSQDVKTTEKSMPTEPDAAKGFWIGTADLQKEFDRIFDSFMQPVSWFPLKGNGGGFRAPWKWVGSPTSFIPDVDIVEKADEHLITAEIPGVDAKDLSVDITGDTLTIKGEKTECSEQKDKNYQLQERHHGAFLRSFPLPRGVDTNKVKAAFDKGILSVSLPKKNGAAPEVKNITISTS